MESQKRVHNFSSLQIPLDWMGARCEKDESEKDRYGSKTYVEIFPDELPVEEVNAGEHMEIVSVLRAEYAPFSVWRACAVRIYADRYATAPLT